MQCVLSFSGTEACALPSTCPLSPALFGSFAPHSPPISFCHLTRCSGPSTEPFKQSRSTTHQTTILASETTKTRHQKISATKHSAFEKDGKSPFWLESQIGSGSFPEKGARVLKWVIAQTYNPHGPRMGCLRWVGALTLTRLLLSPLSLRGRRRGLGAGSGELQCLGFGIGATRPVAEEHRTSASRNPKPKTKIRLGWV